MTTTVIHHSADYDGIFSGEISKKFIPDAELIGWDFSDPPLMTAHASYNQKIYVIDLPIDKPLGLNPDRLPEWVFESVTWIDHHKSSIQSHPKDIPGYRIDGVAACRLAWQWFVAQDVQHNSEHLAYSAGVGLPTKEMFVDRRVHEPLAVRLAGEYDIWDKRDPRSETFQYALRSVEPNWIALLGPSSEFHTQSMCDMGVNVQNYQQRLDENLVKDRSYRLKWEGLDFLVLNTGRFNSLTFAALDKSETGHDALLGYMFNGKKWTVSLYHARHRSDLDLSKIAVKYGGGGHRGACGFTCDKLPFM